MTRPLPAVWPEQPVDYARRPMDYTRAARALNDPEQLEALLRRKRIQDMRDNFNRSERRASVVSSALVVVGFVLAMSILALGLVAFFAPQYLPVLPWNATHVSGGVRG